MEPVKLTTAKKMSRVMKRRFPDVPLEDLQSEAYLYLLTSKEKDPGLEYVRVNWELYHYALGFVTSIRTCSGDALEWLSGMHNEDPAYKNYLTESTIMMQVDAQNGLSEDGVQVLEGVLSGDLLKLQKGAKYNTLSRRLLINNLIDKGWQVSRSRSAVTEVHAWWGEYNG